jgi:hypothetical protein
MLAIALVGMLFVQDPAPAPKVDSDVKSSQSSSSKKLETWKDQDARKKIKEFEKAVKPKSASMAVRKQALDELRGGISPHLVKPLQQFVEKDSSVVLKKQAVEMLADQPQPKSRTAVLKLLKNARVTANPQVQAGLIRALSQTGYRSDEWSEIADVLESDYDTERVPVHEAVLELVTKHKEAKAIPMLLRNLDEPSPKDIDSGENPPAEYWKARWHSWSVWKDRVKEALFAITGQRFTTKEEAKAWLKKNPIKSK